MAATGLRGVSPGMVYLVGAGPGAVHMLTLRAAEVLMSCDVVLHDRLVPAEVVNLAKPGAEVRYVGKDAGVSSEKMKGHQDEISLLMVEYGKKGLSVCRLKGGDPMIYGRAGEEMEELAKAGVPYEVIPAVTAALAAGAEARIPLTYRNLSTRLQFHTLNTSTIRDERFDWKIFNTRSTTHAIYMGLGILGDACQQLLAAGVSGSVPMAVIDRASLPSMQVVTGTVETLPDLVKGTPDLTGPAIVLLGEVVSLRERLASLPLPVEAPAAASLVTSLALLPSLNEEGLRALIAGAEARLRGLQSADAPRDAGDQPPMKRPAPEG